MGLGALVWFLIRVVPRPSRVAYPCQQAALPIAGGFVAWLASLAGAGVLFRWGRIQLGSRKALRAGLCLGLAAGLVLFAVAVRQDGPALADPQPPNDPVGIARGIHPGRVVWVHDPAATDWDGPGDGHWWEPEHTDQVEVSGMLSRALRWLSGEVTDAAAWSALFRHHNQVQGHGEVGYAPGEKIMVKVNFVGCHWSSWGGVDPETYDLVNRIDYMNTSPQVILALLRQLVNVVGVAPADISVGDPLARFPNQYHDYLAAEFPEVRYLDAFGGTDEHPRTQVQFSDEPFYWSCHPSDVAQDYLPRSYAEAAYLINLGNFKSHSMAGITACGKNHYGTLFRGPPASGYYDMHATLASLTPSSGSYRALVDLMGHAHTGDKTVINLVDGLYSGVHPDDMAPRRWDADPFLGDWTSSLFASQDPIAIDSVVFDFMQVEGDPRLYPRMEGVDDYLHEGALAHDPPSGTFYDPDHEGDVERLASLGVHEHWNNPLDRQYSRDLGTGEGIELIRSGPTAVPPAGAPGVPTLTAAPNPFNPQVRLGFSLEREGPVELAVFDLRGVRVTTLLDGELAAGDHAIRWDGRDRGGRAVGSGVYLCRLRAGGERSVRRITLAR